MNTLVFRLAVEGVPAPAREPDAAGGADGGDDDADGGATRVYSADLVWDPQGGQEERLGVRPAAVHPDILLLKLAPGQRVELEAHAVKGVGADHAKFSPVSTASYRLLPRVTLDDARPFDGAEADALVARCPVGVFDIEDLAGEFVGPTRVPFPPPHPPKRERERERHPQTQPAREGSAAANSPLYS